MFPCDGMRPPVERTAWRQALPLDVVSGTRLVARAIGRGIGNRVCATNWPGAIGWVVVGRHVVLC